MRVVSNASPLIILAKLCLFDLPRQLFTEVVISQQVWDDVVIKGTALPGAVETQPTLTTEDELIVSWG